MAEIARDGAEHAWALAMAAREDAGMVIPSGASGGPGPSAQIGIGDRGKVTALDGVPPSMQLVREDGTPIKVGDTIVAGERIALRGVDVTGLLAPESAPAPWCVDPPSRLTIAALRLAIFAMGCSGVRDIGEHSAFVKLAAWLGAPIGEVPTGQIGDLLGEIVELLTLAGELPRDGGL